MLLNQQPIFICGTSRSGSTLLETLFTNNTDFYILPETHFFDDLRVKFANKLHSPLTEEEQKQCENYFLSLTHKPYGDYGDPEKGSLTRQEFQNTLKEFAANSIDSYFKAYCQSRIKQSGKSRWGEKTPRHVFRIDDILSVFPEAKIIYMLRDPRAVIASYRDWYNQTGADFSNNPNNQQTEPAEVERVQSSYHPIIMTLLWLSATKAALLAQKKYGLERVYIQKYENLCAFQEEELKKLYQWLNISPNTQNKENIIPILNSSYLTYQENAGFSQAPIDRWKTKLSEEEIYIIEFFCKNLLIQQNYELLSKKTNIFKLTPYVLSFLPIFIKAVYMNISRSGNMLDYIWRRLKLCILK